MALTSLVWKRWLGPAALVLFFLGSHSAFALTLGRIHVQSAQGQALRAELDIANLSAEESATVKASMAPETSFTAMGLEYKPLFADIQITLERRSDASQFFKLLSLSPVSDKYLDLVLEVRWSTGRIVRNFTLLLDPPKSSEAAKAAETLAAPALTDEPKTTEKAPPPNPAPHTVVVAAGDTAGAIAAQTKPLGTSVEQMLIALQQSNPGAFINGNINQIRAGAVLTVPDQADILKINAQDAAEAVKAQAQTFNDRRNAAAQAAAAKSQSGDQLTLSKGASLEQADLAKIAKERSQKDEAAQTAELAKNIAELNQLAQAAVTLSAPPAPAASSPSPTSSAPAIEKSIPQPTSKNYNTEALVGGAVVLFAALWWYRNKPTASAWTPEPEPPALTEPHTVDSVQTAAKAMGFDLADLSLDLEPPKSGPNLK
ncbi:MAG: hypothetical protein K9J50_04355 [Sulfuritalea sp.]|nr:hypothetical protein [Sulfuritalea sp.]